MIYELEESGGGNLEGEFFKVLSKIEQKRITRDCCQVGFKKVESKRPVKFSLSSCDA